jgi:hypothetical protein
MTIANVTLTNTFDEWRVRTNQLIVLSNESNTLAVAASVVANAGFDKANSANVLGSSAFNTANAGFDKANSANIVGTSAFNAANAGFSQSNTIYQVANLSFNTANAGFGTANVSLNTAISAFDTANGAFVKANSTTFGANLVISVADNTNAALRITQTGTGNALLIEDESNPDTTPFIIDANGNVGIGTTNTSIYRLNVNGSVNASAILVNGAPLAAGGSTITLNEDAENETRYVGFVNAASGNASTINVSSTKLTFNPSTGTLSATIFNSLSDSSLKENVISIAGALDTINSLEGVSFQWKDNGKRSYGVIAQDIEKIIPDVVDSVNGIKNVNYDGIIPFLIEAIKELNRKLDAK